MPFQNILPDPNNTIDSAGKASSTGAGPGFASVNITSKNQIMNQRTNSGRMISRSVSGQSWEVAITYNPLTRTQFDPLYSFLLQKQGRLTHFFLSLPQNKVPQSSAFAKTVRPTTEAVGGVNGDGVTIKAVQTPVDDGDMVVGQQYIIVSPGTSNFQASGATANTQNTIFTATDPGDSTKTGTVRATYSPTGQDNILMSATTYASSSMGAPTPGDFFTVSDSSDSNHTKMYQVVRVETSSSNVISVPSDGTNTETARVWISPALQRNLYDDATLVFHNPLMRVLLSSDVQQYSLNNKNLYNFSLKLQEAQK